MKKTTKPKRSPEMLADYDFSKSAGNKYAKQYAKGTNVVVLAADVAAAFPTSEAVNRALRTLLKNDSPPRRSKSRA